MSNTAIPVEHKSKVNPFVLGLICFGLGALVAGAALYFTAIESGDREVAAGHATIADLKTANSRLSADLAGAQSSLAELTQDRDARQRVINSIDKSVEQLGSGLASGIATIDEVIATIQSVIDILRNG